MILEAGNYYLEHLSDDVNSYELKKFRIQHKETQLTKYLVKFAKKHEITMLNKTYLVRDKRNKNLVAWFSLKNATLPYNDKENSFLIPAIELTHFAVDERYKSIASNDDLSVKTGDVAVKVACKDLFVFAINTNRLIDYYKNRLGFKEIEKLDDKLFFEYAVPDYDDNCRFLYFPLS